MHEEREKKMLHTDLPNLFFEVVSCEFQKHFLKQWCGTDLKQLTIASAPKVSSSFSKWLLNIPIPNESFYCQINKSTTHLPSRVDFITHNASLEDAKSSVSFLSLKMLLH